MGIQVSGPEFVAFLEWLRVNHPDARSFRQLGEHRTQTLADAFAHEALGLAPDELKGRSRANLLHPTPRWMARDLTLVAMGKDQLRGARQGSPRFDYLDRYLQVEMRAVFLYTTQDDYFGEYMNRNWTAWSDESGDIFDFYDYDLGRAAEGKDQQAYTFSRDYIRSLRAIGCADPQQIEGVGLPCMLVWSNTDSAIIPFSDVEDDSTGIRTRFRLVARLLKAGNFDVLRATFAPQLSEATLHPNDVFISYAHADREWVSAFHDALEERGFSTWYDDHIRAGDRFDLRIARHLDCATAAIVVWSQASARSRWVTAEALYADGRGRLVPTAKEWPLDIPLPFNAIHTEDLSGWPEAGSDAFERVITAIEGMRSRSRPDQ